MKPLNWILRILVLGGLAILFIPVINLPKPGALPRIILLVDASFSMSDQKKQLQYLKLVEELKALQGDIILDAYRFADSLVPVNNPATIKFNGAHTDIRSALDLLDPADADLILLVSDGRHNGPENPEGRQLAVPIQVIAIGEENLPDIGIEEVDMLDSARIRIRLRSNLNSEALTQLSFYKDNDKIAKHEVRIAGDGLTELTLPIPNALSETSFRLELNSLPAEDRLDNNSFFFHPARKSKTLKILFVAGAITLETESILQALRSLPGIKLSTCVEIAPGIIMGETSGRPDVLVVGPLRADLSVLTQRLIKSNAEKGIPILFIASTEQSSPGLSNLFPMKITQRKLDPAPPWQRSPLAQLLMANWQPQTAYGEHSSSMMYVTKPGAQTLLGENGAVFMAKTNTPVRTVQIQLPGLLEAIRMDREGFRNFIRTTLVFLAEGAGFPFRFEVEEATDASLRIELASEVEITGHEIQAWLIPDSHALCVMPLSAHSLRLSGTPPAGNYRLYLGWNDQGFAPKGEVGVTEALPEQPSRGANHQLLAHLAKQNSGKLLAREELKDVIQSLPRRKTFNFKPLQTPYLVILVGILLLVEIWHRRKAGLP